MAVPMVLTRLRSPFCSSSCVSAFKPTSVLCSGPLGRGLRVEGVTHFLSGGVDRTPILGGIDKCLYDVDVLDCEEHVLPSVSFVADFSSWPSYSVHFSTHCTWLFMAPYGIGQAVIFFVLCFLLCSFNLFSSPDLSRHRLDVCHTSTHGAALVRI